MAYDFMQESMKAHLTASVEAKRVLVYLGKYALDENFIISRP